MTCRDAARASFFSSSSEPQLEIGAIHDMRIFTGSALHPAPA
jgi:hypothetical protein